MIMPNLQFIDISGRRIESEHLKEWSNFKI